MISASLTLNACLPARQAKRLKLKAVVILSLFLLITYHLLLITLTLVHAQDLPSLGGVAVNVEIKDSDVRQGDIISITKDGFKRSVTEYDVLIFGVVVNAPILSVEPRDDSTRSVLSSGETLVRVSGANGEIAEGDLITTSVQA